MRKRIMLLIFSMGLVLAGCGNGGGSHGQNEGDNADEAFETQNGNTDADEVFGTQNENAFGEEDNKTQNESGVYAVQGGPYGRISIAVPAGWSYELCPIDSENLLGMYGIHIYPEDAENGYVEIAYVDSFGVCGTGLAEERKEIAGTPAYVGTYDSHEYWDFVSFEEENEGIVALTYCVDGWWSEYGDQVSDILDTLSYDQSVKEGGAYIYNDESWADKIALYFSLKNISATGANLVFRQSDPEAPLGDLEYGDDYIIERKKDGAWEEVPVVIEGDYGVDAIAYMITAGDTTEREINWEWLYGELAPGEYRIGKVITDFRGSGEYDEYTVYAYFILT